MIEISEQIYREIAASLREAIGAADYFNGAVEYESEELYARLVTTAIIYRREEILPEGKRRVIADVVPVWWELRTEQTFGEVMNDFSFAELKQYLIDDE